MHGMGKRAQALRVALGWGWTDHPGSRILGEWCYGGGGVGWWPVAQKNTLFLLFLETSIASSMKIVTMIRKKFWIGWALLTRSYM